MLYLKGRNIEFNALIANIDRILGIISPILVGIFLSLISFLSFFQSIVVLLIISIIILFKKIKNRFQKNLLSKIKNATNYKGLLQLFKRKKILWHIMLPLLGYGMFLGGLKPYLIYSTIETFNYPEEKWTVLLTIHELGALMVA